MGTLQIWLFGMLQLDHEDYAIDLSLPPATLGLLAYLLLFRDRIHSRGRLAGIFWGDRGNRKARRCLNTALWRLRSALEPEGVERGTYLIATPTDGLRFNQESDYWLDAAIFEERARQVLAFSRGHNDQFDVGCLQESTGLWRGELLEGIDGEWVLRERERMRLLYLRCLRRLMYAYRQQGAFEESLACARQILDCDPLREEIHREVMRLFCDLGQRPLAVRQYQLCCEILTDELGIPPMEETQALFGRIAGPDLVCPQPPAAGYACLRQATRQLRQAVDESAVAQQKLRQAMAHIERLIPPDAAETPPQNSTRSLK